MEDDIGERYWRETKYRRGDGGSGLDWDNRPDLYKICTGAEKIVLPSPKEGKAPFDEVVRRRRSERSYSSAPLDVETLSYLIWTTAGINRRDRGHEFRTVPSAGALYPIESYLCVNRVDGLRPGIYHYAVRQHALELLKEGELGRKMAHAGLEQRMLEESAVDFVWSSLFQRSIWKYGQRAYRYVLLDAGHIAQNLALACSAAGLGCCHVAAFYDDEVNAIIGLDGEKESAVYMSSVGHTLERIDNI